MRKREGFFFFFFLNGDNIKGDTEGEGLHIRALLLQNQTTRPTHRRQSTTMPSSALLCCLVFLAGVGASQDQSRLSENNCSDFPANLPNMLRELRAAFSRVKTFFVSMMPPVLPSLRPPELGILLKLQDNSFLFSSIPSTHCPQS